MDRTITTRRLVLSPYGLSEFEDLSRLWADPEVTRFIGGRPNPQEQVWARVLRNIGHWQAFGYGYWTMRERQGGAFVGEVGFGDNRRDLQPSLGGAPEMGWALTPSAQGRGLAAEATQAALAWARTRLPRRVVCLIDPQNAPSLRLAEALGFVEFAATSYHGDPVLLFERT